MNNYPVIGEVVGFAADALPVGPDEVIPVGGLTLLTLLEPFAALGHGVGTKVHHEPEQSTDKYVRPLIKLILLNNKDKSTSRVHFLQ